MSFYRDEQFDKLSERWANVIIARERGAAKPKDVSAAFNAMTGYLDARFQAATEAAKAESQDDNKPAMYCVPDKDGKPLFGKGWMFSPIPHLAATMPLYTRTAAKATGTAGELPPMVDAWYHGITEKHFEHAMYAYGQQCAEAARQSLMQLFLDPENQPTQYGTVLAARQPAPVVACTCPSGDGSLRWPCPQHPPLPVAITDKTGPNGIKWYVEPNLPDGVNLYIKEQK